MAPDLWVSVPDAEAIGPRHLLQARWRGEEVLVAEQGPDRMKLQYLGDLSRVAEFGLDGDSESGWTISVPAEEVTVFPHPSLVLSTHRGVEVEVTGAVHGRRLTVASRATPWRGSASVPAAECGDVWSMRTTATWRHEPVLVVGAVGERIRVRSAQPLPGLHGDPVHGWQGLVPRAEVAQVRESLALLRPAGLAASRPEPGESPLAKVRRVLELGRADDLMVVYGTGVDEPPSAPDHRWVLYATSLGAVVLGGWEQGVLAKYARFVDPLDAGAVLARLLLAAPPEPDPRPEADLVALGREFVREAGELLDEHDVPGWVDPRRPVSCRVDLLGSGAVLVHRGNGSGHLLQGYGTLRRSSSPASPGQLDLPVTGYRVRRALPASCTVRRSPAGPEIVLDRAVAAYVTSGHMVPFRAGPRA